jgi:hypothetical protein
MTVRNGPLNLFAASIFLIGFYTFLLWNGVFEGEFDNDPLAWLVLGLGIFASVCLYLLIRLVEAIVDLARRR